MLEYSTALIFAAPLLLPPYNDCEIIGNKLQSLIMTEILTEIIFCVCTFSRLFASPAFPLQDLPSAIHLANILHNCTSTWSPLYRAKA